MSEVLKKIREFMENEGIPGRDSYELPTSKKLFRMVPITALKSPVLREPQPWRL